MFSEWKSLKWYRSIHIYKDEVLVVCVPQPNLRFARMFPPFTVGFSPLLLILMTKSFDIFRKQSVWFLHRPGKNSLYINFKNGSYSFFFRRYLTIEFILLLLASSHNSLVKIPLRRRVTTTVYIDIFIVTKVWIDLIDLFLWHLSNETDGENLSTFLAIF